MERPQLKATHRQQSGSRVVNRLRRQGLIPGIVYGKKTAAMPVLINERELIRMLKSREGEHGLVTLTIEPGEGGGAKKAGRWEQAVLIKHLERDCVAGQITHIDFHAITLTEHIRIKIPIVLQGVPVGVKQDGGLLEHFSREIEVDCLPTEIPKEVVFDIANLKIGDTVHVKDLPEPSGAKITSDPEGVIASVHAPKAEKVEEAAEAVTEPEVIREKKPEAEGEAGAEAPKAKEEKPEKSEKKEKTEK